MAIVSLDSLSQDGRLALRGLIKRPAFAAAAVLTLGLGIGATSGMFSVVKAVVLAPLPYSRPERLVMIWSRWTDYDKTWVSDQEVIDYRHRASTLSGIAAWSVGQQNMTGDGQPLRITVGLVSVNLFDVLGTRPFMGRRFSPDEDQPNGPPVVLLSHALWRTRFGADAAVIGRKTLLDDVPVEIIGVMPPDFRLPTDFTVDAAEPSQMWRRLQMNEQLPQRGNHRYYVAALLSPGQTARSATEELRAITRRLTEEGQYDPAMQFSAFAEPLDDAVRGAVRPTMWLLMGAVSFLLLIACVNVANLLLVRGDARLRDIAVVTALGATPNRLAQQLLVEAFVLGSLGAILGLAIASASVAFLPRIAAVSRLQVAAPAIDATTILFTLALAGTTTFAFGMVPVARILKINLVESLREGGQQSTIGGARKRLRSMLVAAEVSLAVVLVIGAGLMIRSLDALSQIDLGFNPENVLTAQLALPATRYDSAERVVTAYRQILTSVRAVPGVRAAGIVRALPLATVIGDAGLDVEGFDELAGGSAKGDWQVVSDGAFEAMGMHLDRGRWFTAADRSDSQLVAVVNETMAQRYWGGRDAIGGRIRLGANKLRPWVTVVGVVGNEKHNGVTGDVKEKFYVPHDQWHMARNSRTELLRNMFLVVRTDRTPLSHAGAVRQAISAVDANLPVSNVRLMTDVVAASLTAYRLTGILLGMFAAVALTLAAVGIYGVLTYSVGRRTQEIGIRVAIGAHSTQILGMILREGLALVGTGLIVGLVVGPSGGLVAAIALTRLMRSLLYQVDPSDPVTFIIVSGMVVLIAAIASAVPALRAMHVSPLVALRTE
jgi:putative ABC transport system permease protein